MALTNCPECGHEVSKRDFICPSCSHQIKEERIYSQTEKIIRGLISWTLGSLLIGGFVYSFV